VANGRDVAYLSASSVHRILDAADLLYRWKRSASSGTAPAKPMRPHERWHADLMYLRIKDSWYFLVTVLDAYRRYVVYWELLRIIGDVRGPGLMEGVEFTTPAGKPDPATAELVHRACLQKNLLLLMCGTCKNVIRWIPPLVVTESQIRDALEIIESGLAQVTSDSDRSRTKDLQHHESKYFHKTFCFGRFGVSPG
jgi:hypothetical protein